MEVDGNALELVPRDLRGFLLRLSIWGSCPWRARTTKLQELTGMQLNDQTCQGALTDHVLGPREDLPPQIDAVDSTTDVVTLSIGGNDAAPEHDRSMRPGTSDH